MTKPNAVANPPIRTMASLAVRLTTTAATVKIEDTGIGQEDFNAILNQGLMPVEQKERHNNYTHLYFLSTLNVQMGIIVVVLYLESRENGHFASKVLIA
jgi:hypothetical protein